MLFGIRDFDFVPLYPFLQFDLVGIGELEQDILSLF